MSDQSGLHARLAHLPSEYRADVEMAIGQAEALARKNANKIVADLRAALERLVKATGQIGLIDSHVEEARRAALATLAKVPR